MNFKTDEIFSNFFQRLSSLIFYIYDVELISGEWNQIIFNIFKGIKYCYYIILPEGWIKNTWVSWKIEHYF